MQRRKNSVPAHGSSGVLHQLQGRLEAASAALGLAVLANVQRDTGNLLGV